MSECVTSPYRLIHLLNARRGRTAVRFPANNYHMCAVELSLKGVSYACPRQWPSGRSVPDGYAMLMRPRNAETAVHGCYCPSDMALQVK